MNKLFRSFILVGLISSIFLTGCGGKDNEVDTHYKPSEYKHETTINEANRTVSSIDDELLVLGSNTPVDVVLKTYNDSITKLNEQLTKLESTKAKLNDDDLTKSEIKAWNAKYEDSIDYVKRNLNKVNNLRTEFLK